MNLIEAVEKLCDWMDEAKRYGEKQGSIHAPYCKGCQNVNRVRDALTAHRAEILERRKKSPWKGPFTVEDYQDNGHDWFGINDASVTVEEVRGGYADYADAKRDCEMLNSYYGFNPATGEDECK